MREIDWSVELMQGKKQQKENMKTNRSKINEGANDKGVPKTKRA